MNYKEMSDKYLSKLVAENIGLVVGDSLSTLRNNLSATVHNGDGFWFEFDINSPADMWPIIVEHGISIECIKVNNHENTWKALCKSFYFKNKNPLRAAAIVFLMMKDAEKAQ